MTTKHSAEENEENRLANIAGRLHRLWLEGDQRKAVNSMTNWQRNQWAKAGYPQDLDTVEAFAARQRSET